MKSSAFSISHCFLFSLSRALVHVKSAILGKEQVLMMPSWVKRMQGTQGKSMDIEVRRPLNYFWQTLIPRKAISFSEPPAMSYTMNEYDSPRWAFGGLGG